MAEGRVIAFFALTPAERRADRYERQMAKAAKIRKRGTK